MAEVDRRYLGRIETGEVQEPGVETVGKLARALSISIRALANTGWYDDEPTRDQQAAAEEAIVASDLSEEKKQAALEVIRALFR